jgi:hypothetical protein
MSNESVQHQDASISASTLLVAVVANRFDDKDKHSIIKVMETYPDEVLQAIIDVFDNTSELSAVERKRAITQITWLTSMSCPSSFITAFLTYEAGIMQWNCTPVNDLHQYRELGWIPTLTAPEEDARDKALMWASREIVHIFAYNREPVLGTTPTPGVVPAAPMFDLEMFHPRLNPTRLLSDARLVCLIWERPDDDERIVAVFSERNNVEYETLVRILDAASPALSEGVL